MQYQTNRRQLLGGTLAIAAGLLTLSSGSASAQTPKRGGNFRIAVPHGSTTDTLDPARNEHYFVNLLSFAVTNMLVEIDANNTPQPCVAESWEVSKDASTWTFTLRKGVNFHSGKLVTPADVIASVNHHRAENSISSLKTELLQIATIRADGDRRVVFELMQPNADFVYVTGHFMLGIFPAADDGSLNWQSNDGCGGYILKTFEPGVRATLERNPNYWRSDRAFFDSAEIQTIYDANARTNALRAGTVDCIGQVDIKIADRLAQVPGISIKQTSGPLHYSFPMNTQVAPFTDKNVRLALKYATNREDILKKILRGHGKIGNDSPIGPSYKYYSKDIPQRTYDIDKARFHLKKAGHDSLNLEIYTADAAFTGAVDAATLLKEHVAPAGINIKVVRASNDTYYSDTWMKKPWSMTFWGGFPSIDSMMTQGYSSGAAWNDTFFKDERFNELLVEARGELDEAKRADLYRELQFILHEEGGAIIPVFTDNLFAATDKLKHRKLSASYDLDGLCIVDRWWFEG